MLTSIVIVIILLIILSIYLFRIRSHHERRHHKKTTISSGNETHIHLTEGVLNEWLNDKNTYTSLYLSNKHEKKSVLPKNFKLINIDSNAFNQIKTSLSHLYLDHNLISHIDVDSFIELESLKTLRLDFNRLKSLKLNFAKENKLENLYLNNNEIFSIGFDTFSNLKGLLILDLSFNKLGRISDYFFNGLTSLKIYCLNNNEIDEVNMNQLELVKIRKEEFFVNFKENKLDKKELEKLREYFNIENKKCN